MIQEAKDEGIFLLTQDSKYLELVNDEVSVF